MYTNTHPSTHTHQHARALLCVPIIHLLLKPPGHSQCDIKTPNILLGTSGNAKIGDMVRSCSDSDRVRHAMTALSLQGMSRSLLKDQQSVTKSASVGTWSWAAPEVCRVSL